MMRLFTFIRSIVMDFHAWRRGERRVAPRAKRGRIYEKKDPSSGAHVVETKTVYTTLARVIRADGRPDEHYNLTEDITRTSDDFDTLRGGKKHG